MAQILKRLRTWRFPLLIFGLTSASHVGCGHVTGYPETTIASPIGREGVCVSCQKKITSVNEGNLVTFAGNQFIVCDEVCAKKAEGVTEHSHAH